MNKIRKIHLQAMEQADLAFAAAAQGKHEDSKRHRLAAYEFEARAANFLFNKCDAEPTRSVLYRSAATLAKDCGLISEAERLISCAMAGNPPAQIADELRDLLDQVTFQRHLELRGVSLGDDEVQMVIAGQSVGPGFAPADVFLSRVQSTETLLYRTAARKQNKPYRDGGRPDAQLARDTELYLSVPRAASFAVTLRVGGSLDPSLPGFSPSEGIIDEVLDCLQLYIQGDEAGLEARIKDEAYYTNFVGLARNIQPDGVKINLVGFTALRKGKKREVAMTRPSPNLAAHVLTQRKNIDVETSAAETETVEYRGNLLIANAKNKSKHQSGTIDIVTSDGRSVKISVPPGMMSDIVKPLWESEVEVLGFRKGKKIQLLQIKSTS